MYFKDLTKYEYTTKEDSLHIGWLEKGHLFDKGDVPKEFVEKLWKYLRYPVCVCRGFHVCDFCENQKTEVPIVKFKGKRREVGYYEIRVWGKAGSVYAAPSLIFHYIVQHGYKPPQEFIDAVMESEEADSDEYYQKVLEYSDGNDFWLAHDRTKKTLHHVSRLSLPVLRLL